MSLTSEIARNQIAMTGAGTYVITFSFAQNADVKASVQYADGSIVGIALTTDYTLTGAGNPSGGTITVLSSVDDINGNTLVIYRDPPKTQTVEMVQNDPLPVDDYIERPVDKLTAIAQRLFDITKRSFRLQDGDASLDDDGLVPNRVERANKIPAWDAAGKLYALAGYLPSSLTVSSFVETLLAITTAPLFRDAIDAVSEADVNALIAASGTLSGLLPMQCRLNYVNTTTARLDRFNGNKIVTLDGSSVATLRTLPSPGPTLAPGAMIDLTLYYVYAYWNGAAVALESSTTAPVTDATTGLPVKNADASRVLVGAVFLIGGNFIEIDSTKSVSSFWNRRRRTLKAVLTVDGVLSATSATEISTEFRSRCVQWADSLVSAWSTGRFWNDTGGAANKTLIAAGPEGGAYTNQVGVSTGTPANNDIALANVPVAASAQVESTTTRLLRLQLMGFVSSGTGTWDGHATDVDKQNVLFSVFEG